LVRVSIYRTSSISCCGLKACWLAYPSSFDLVTPLHLLPSVDLCTPYLSAISLKENCSPSSRDFKSSIASSIGAMVVELSCVEVHESRRSMMFGGAQGRSGHKPDGHVTHCQFTELTTSFASSYSMLHRLVLNQLKPTKNQSAL
jgi:hypothetical protein